MGEGGHVTHTRRGHEMLQPGLRETLVTSWLKLSACAGTLASAEPRTSRSGSSIAAAGLDLGGYLRAAVDSGMPERGSDRMAVAVEVPCQLSEPICYPLRTW